MLFSIVIPVYNVEKYLDECMQSILCQVEEIHRDCEILLVDDGSQDNSGRICDNYQKKNPDIIKVYHKENQGLLATRRYGFQKSSGDYIINCDSDDLFECNMFESVKKIIDKYNNPDIIFINHYSYDGEIKTVGYDNIFTSDHDCVVSKNAVICEFMSRHSIVSVCGKIVKRSCIDIDRDYKEYGRLSTGEDTLQSIEFFSNASTFVYLNETLYDYRCGSGMTAKFDANYYFTFKHIFEQIEKEKYSWGLSDFERLFAVKVLQTAGRAITQSRYNKWNNAKEQKKYLKRIADDEMLKNNIQALNHVKRNLQKGHVILLKMLSLKMYSIIIALLNLKNKVEKRKNRK